MSLFTYTCTCTGTGSIENQFSEHNEHAFEGKMLKV